MIDNKPLPKESIDRWKEIGVLGILAPLTFLPIWFWTRTWFARFASLPGWVLIFSFLAALIWAMWGARNRGGIQALLAIRHFLRYPPVWFGAVPALGFLGLLLGVSGVFRTTLLLPTSSGIGFMIVGTTGLLISAACVIRLLSLRARWVKDDGVSCPTNEPSFQITSSDKQLGDWSFEKLIQWASDDSPIKSSDMDCLGHYQIANRMARRFLSKERPPSQALLGRLGSGKTSLGNLLENELERSEAFSRIRFVRIELWPFETAEAAARGILDKLLDEIAKDADVIGLRGLPTQYIEAISLAGGPWRAIARLQGASNQPHEILNRVNRVAVATDIRFILWIEDLERFAGLQGEAPSMLEADAKLNQVRALLHGLDEIDDARVAAITATASLHGRIDIEKTARYIERIPSLDGWGLAQLLGTFRMGCAVTFPQDINPNRDEGIDDFNALHSEDSWSLAKILSEQFDNSIPSVAISLARLCQSPRVLKQGIRRCWEIWQSLHGEIDFESLLIVCLIRAASPASYAYLESEVSSLRRIAEKGHGRTSPLYRTLIDAINLVEKDPTLAQDVITCFAWLFDTPGPVQGIGSVSKRGPQYWNRLISERVPIEEERDQPVLYAIRNGDIGSLAEILESMDESQQFLRFKSRVLTAKAIELLPTLVQRRLNENPRVWPELQPGFIVPPGFSGISQMWRSISQRGDWDDQKCSQVIERVLRETVSQNLPLAFEIEYWILMPEQRQSSIFNDETRERLRALLRSLVHQHYTGNPRRLANSLDGSQSRSLLWFSCGLDRVRKPDFDGSPYQEGWPAFASTILEAAREFPRVICPQLAMLVTRRVGEHGRSAEYDPILAEKNFGSSEAVLEIFRTTNLEEDNREPEVEAVLKAAKS
jgi:hypothetical protein